MVGFKEKEAKKLPIAHFKIIVILIQVAKNQAVLGIEVIAAVLGIDGQIKIAELIHRGPGAPDKTLLGGGDIPGVATIDAHVDGGVVIINRAVDPLILIVIEGVVEQQRPVAAHL
ncbi:MAG TPA: hypothetical protein DEH25_08340 [Chloroflexi bacterium]|nr:hypothetical protein [Chloroflexota bacterium]